MGISEKVAYLQGLAEGMKLDESTNEGKLLMAIIDVLDDMAEEFADVEDEIVDLEDTETEPGLAGNTATNTLKPVTVETGAEVKVPLFINIGDKITIDTRTGEYLGRAK